MFKSYIVADRLKYTFCQSIKVFLQSASPCKSITFYRQYFPTAESVAAQKDRSSIYLFKVYLFFILYFVFLNTILFPFVPLSEPTRVLLADGVSLLVKDRQFYFIYAGIAIYTILLYWSMYFAYSRPLNDMLKRAFSEEKILNAETGLRLPLIGAALSFRQIILMTINTLQVFTLIIDICCPIFGLMAGKAFFDCYFTSSANSLLWMTLLLQVNLFHILLNCLIWFAFGHVLILVGVNFTVGLTYIVLQFRANNSQLVEELRRRRKRNSRFSSTIANRWQSHHLLFKILQQNLANFHLVFLFDSFYGKQTLVYFVLHGPISAYFMSQIMFGYVSLLPSTIMLGVSLEAYVGSLLLHLYIAYSSEYIHRGGKMLLSYNASISGSGNVNPKDRLLLFMHIQRLVCRRKYGVTYGGLGLVSMKAFTRFVLLYSEFLMYCYTLVKKR